MTAIRVTVTAEHIAAAPIVPNVGDGFRSAHADSKDPVELAIADATGQAVMCDEDGPGQEIATIGAGRTTVVISLPPEVAPWIDRYFRGEAVEPFEFDLEFEQWLVALIARAATADEQADAVIATEAAAS